MALDKRVLAI
ncbi:unnamed protein product, partial [Rotaria sordida]